LSMIYGLYITAIGAAAVFVSLLAIVLASEVLVRVFPETSTTAVDTGLKKVAAVAAVYSYLGGQIEVRGRREANVPSNWAREARSEALDRRVETG